MMGLVGYGKLERYAILVAGHSRDVSFAGRILDQIDVPWPHGELLAAGYFNLSLAAKRDHVLASRSRMPIDHRAGGRAMQFRSGDRHQLENLVVAASGEFSLGLLEVRLPVGASVEARHHEGFVFLGTARLGARQENEQHCHSSTGEQGRSRFHSITSLLRRSGIPRPNAVAT